MARPELLGVSSAIRDSEVAPLSDADQDRLIAEEAQRLQGELAKFVGGAQPYKGRALVFDVKGPLEDPLQGVIHVHTVAGYFDLDRLPTDCEAYRTHVMAGPDVTRTATPETIQENKP